MIRITYNRIAATLQAKNLPYEIRCRLTADHLGDTTLDGVETGLNSLSEAFWFSGADMPEWLDRYLAGNEVWEYEFKYYDAWLLKDEGGVCYAARFGYDGLRLSGRAARDFVRGWLECLRAPEGQDLLAKDFDWEAEDLMLTEPQTAWG